METKSNAKLKALFIIPSIVGIILFMIPVKNADGDWTVVDVYKRQALRQWALNTAFAILPVLNRQKHSSTV